MVTAIFTFQDMAEFLWGTFNPATKPPTGRELRTAKQAVVTAYRDILNIHNWLYYNRRIPLRTEATQSTSTIAYDHTGGSYERMVTIAAGTWPTTAARGVIVIAGVHYDVEDYKSTTVITLGVNSNPGADIAAGTTYSWYRESYPLPVNFRKLSAIAQQGGNYAPLDYIDATSDMFLARDLGVSTGDPTRVTIGNDGDYIGALSLIFSPAPATAVSYDVTYQASQRPLHTYKYATGTVTVAAGSTAVLGIATAFTSFHAGSIIRFTESTTVEPTDVAGNCNGDDNPFIAQRMVMSVTDGTHLIIDSAVSATSTLTGTKYVISDPIDIEPIVMRTYFECLCEYHYARLTKQKEQAEMYGTATRELLIAMNADSRCRQLLSAASDGASVGWSDTWGDVAAPTT